MEKQPSVILPDFQIFIKPVGPACNLDCSYCYYIDHGSRFRTQSTMTHGILEGCIQRHIEATPVDTILFSWHGGEPLLAGLDFYKQAVTLQKKYCPPGKTIINGIQTNGTLIDESWCQFLAEENFQVGISLDGPSHLHNYFRKSRDHQGSFDRVLRGFDLLALHNLDPEIVCVVNSLNVNYPVEVYRFIRQLGVSNVTFIPLVEPARNEPKVSRRSVNAGDYGSFLCAVFDQWLANDIGKIKIQIVEEALRKAFGQEHSLCIFRPVCGRVGVIEHNGDFYACDHYVNEAHLRGNIGDTSLTELLNCRAQVSFGMQKKDTLPAYCRNCVVKEMCNGECPKNRILKSPDGEQGLNYLCDGYKKFFSHCMPFIEAVANVYKKNQIKSASPRF